MLPVLRYYKTNERKISASVKKLMNHSRAKLNKILSKSYVFQNKATIKQIKVVFLAIYFYYLADISITTNK